MIEYIALTNFLSFKDRTILNFKATKEKPRGALSGEDWWTEIDGSKILKIAFLLGNNGSGKTNFLNSISVLNEIITINHQSKSSIRNRLPRVSFKLSHETENAPSIIEVAFYTGGYRYIYYVSWNSDYISEESLKRQIGKRKEKTIFERTFDEDKDITIVRFPEKSIVPEAAQAIITENVLKNSSVISIYDNKNFECPDIRNVFEYFRYVDLWNVKKYDLASMLASRSNEQLLKPILLTILKDLGSSICDYKVDNLSFDITNDEREFLLMRMTEDEYRSRFPGDKRSIQKLQFGYKVEDIEEKIWLPENLESEGTLEAIRLIIVLFDSIWRGTPIAIDEFAQSIHPKALEFILSFFLKSTNSGQVFIATQALILLKWSSLRRDSIRFFEKDKRTGCSSYTTVNNRTFHRNNDIYDAYMNKTFGGDIGITETEPWKATLDKIARCMKEREWNY